MTHLVHASFTQEHRPRPIETMADPTLRVCPTRIDGAPVLVAHKVDTSRCQERQRERYHKCFTCAWNNNHVAKHGEPSIEASPEPAAEVETAPAS